MSEASEGLSANQAVTAVVVNHDGGEQVLHCIEALDRSTVPLHAILVVDNDSRDGSRERIARRFPEVEILALTENAGPAPARNAGLEHATTPLVLLVDDDVMPAPDCLEALLRARAETGAEVVTPRVVLHPDRTLLQCDGADAHFIGTMTLRGAYSPLSLATAEKPHPVGAVISSCLLVEREAMLELGGFDPLYFLYLEDLEISIRLRSRGLDLCCAPEAVAYHDRGEGTAGLSFRSGAYPARRAYLSHRNRWLTLLIHYRLRTLLLLTPPLAAYEVASLLFCVLRGHAREWLRSWAFLFGHAGEIRARRRRVQTLRVRSDAELLSGGALPLAPGTLISPFAAGAAAILSRTLDAWWIASKRWVG